MGGEKLIYGGFIYTKCKDGKDKRYWRCENWRSDKCHGTATTDNNNSVTVGQEHNHGPSPTRVELARIKNNINKSAINSTLSPRAVVNSQLAGISDKAKASLPKLKNLEKTVGRKRYASGEIFSIFRVDHMVSILWVIRYFGCRYFGSFDTLGVDILGVDTLVVDTLGWTPSPSFQRPIFL
uniref:FLYWCH-type domain-containing protein n=1 Tax=Meloidogyne incognita TaxID=6306 RepID=A0A914LPC8_MELIC